MLSRGLGGTGRAGIGLWTVAGRPRLRNMGGVGLGEAPGLGIFVVAEMVQVGQVLGVLV